ncbi:MAG: BON domain-containing protein [Gammaproteobacteria bacterium]
MRTSPLRFCALVALASFSLLGSGCAALLVGGAAAGGYVVGKDDRPVGTQIDDGTITASVKTKLLADKYAPGWRIDVDTLSGVVTLNGRVKSYVARAQAEKLARETRGVKSVVNKLDVIDPE